MENHGKLLKYILYVKKNLIIKIKKDKKVTEHYHFTGNFRDGAHYNRLYQKKLR